MTKHKFKVGDKVRGGGGGCVIIYTIIYCATANDTTRSPMYLLEAENKTHVYAYERELELANMIYKFKVGDSVKTLYGTVSMYTVVYLCKTDLQGLRPGYLLQDKNGCHSYIQEEYLEYAKTNYRFRVDELVYYRDPITSAVSRTYTVKHNTQIYGDNHCLLEDDLGNGLLVAESLLKTVGT